MSASTRGPRANAADPTKTATLRTTYARRLRAPLREMVNAIKRGVRDRDAFDLAGNAHGPRPPQRTEVPRLRGVAGRRLDAFTDWLDRALEQGLLSVVTRDRNPYIDHAYRRGLDHANRQLAQAGVTLPGDADSETAIARGLHRDALDRLRSKNYEELRGIAHEMERQMVRELTDALSSGASPAETAAALVDRVEAIGIDRATTLAETEVVAAHSEATLTRYEELDERPDTDIQINAVTLTAEFVTAGDSKVCPTCAAIAGKQVEIEGIREENFRYRGEQFPIQPPIHPNCRCAMVPVTQVTDEAPHRS